MFENICPLFQRR